MGIATGLLIVPAIENPTWYLYSSVTERWTGHPPISGGRQVVWKKRKKEGYLLEEASADS